MDKFVKHTQIIGYFFDRTTYEFKLDFHASKELSLMWLLVRLPVGIVQAWSEVLMKVEMYALLNSGSKCTTCKSTSWWQAIQPDDEQKLENATESRDRKTINVDLPHDASSLNTALYKTWGQWLSVCKVNIPSFGKQSTCIQSFVKALW